MKFDIVEKIKSNKWDNRVSRPGFLQSKVIIEEAEIIPVALTEKVSVKYDNQMWVKEHCLYDQVATESFPLQFYKAFADDKKWPLYIIKKFDQFEDEKKQLVKKLSNVEFTEAKNFKANILYLF